MALGSELDIDLNSPIPRRVRAWKANGLFVHATARSVGRPPRSIALSVDGAPYAAIAQGVRSRRPGDGARASFWGIVPLEASAPVDTARIGAVAELEHGRRLERGLGESELLGVPDRPREAPDGSAASVAICMATHEPPPELLGRQLDSLRAQTHDDWICLISDDASSPRGLGALDRAIDGDPRFVVSRSQRRLGAYENFHRALRMVPPQVDHVALSDQDDAWYPEKLARLLGGLGDAELVFSDMRVVTADGSVLAPTYWTRRQPNHANFASLMLGNTVTGAASLFPRRLLDDALPFPPRVGNCYHDHWLALVAAALGRIAYLPEPLYDYVQHADAVIGHAGANRGVVGGSPLRRLVALRGREGGRLRSEWQRIYFAEYCRMRLQAQVLEWRLGARMAPAQRHALRLALLPDRSPILATWLAGRQVRRLWRDETMGSEAAMLRALAWRSGAPLIGRRPAGTPYDDADLPAGAVAPADASAAGSPAATARTLD